RMFYSCTLPFSPSQPGSHKAEKFDYFELSHSVGILQLMDFVKKMVGMEYVGFSNATFQSEKETGDRNFAISYYLKEKKFFPRGADMIDALDFYFQVTCESGSVIAATLANGGICPITGERVLSSEAMKNTLSLMHSCGTYDYSGQFAIHMGLPAKSGVSGVVLLVVPNVMGVWCWSPPLDKVGNSVRGIQFFQSHKPNKSVMNLMFAAQSGDVSALRRYHEMLALMFFFQAKWMLTLNPVPVCKGGGNIPLDDVVQFGHASVVKILQNMDVSQARPDHTDQPKLNSVEGTI
uniref:glutaminase n=1 Tax=Electrophorus electricus TaxID=8005 RepID=A0A4W4EVJ9_ELEEL